MYSSTFALTSALDGCSTPRFGRFTPKKDLLPIVEDAEWAPQLSWTGAKNLAFEPWTDQPVASRCTDNASPGQKQQ